MRVEELPAEAQRALWSNSYAWEDRLRTRTDNDEGANRSFAIALPRVELPKGGGAIRGIGEKFSANPVSGTGSMSVPIATSPGRSGFGPQLSLSYDSGAGNGPFGSGWSLSLPSITRKTDKGLPKYFDAEDSDVFILSGAEDLVPVYRQDADGTWVAGHMGYQRDPVAFWVRDQNGRLVIHEDELDGYRVRRYRPRIEGLFARIERWSKIGAPSDVHWRSISKDNILTIYGFDSEFRIADPLNASRIFTWLICETRDDKGKPCSTATRWRTALASLRTTRTNAIEGRKTTSAARPTATCEAGVGRDCLVRSTDFTYSDEVDPKDVRNPVYTFLEAVTQTGYRRNNGGYDRRGLPPVEFEYSEVIVQGVLEEVNPQSLENLPIGLEPGLTDGEARALLLRDTVIPPGLSLDEEREACRALKGSMLRQEVYADDAGPNATTDQIQRACTPHTVTEQNFTIRTIQPRGSNRHAVFFTHACDAISYHYERNPSDPRVQHALTLEVDDYGNVLKQAAIGYGRRANIRVLDEHGNVRQVPNPGLAVLHAIDQGKLTTPPLTYTENRVTNAIELVDTHCNPLPCEAVTFDYEAAVTANPCRRPIEWLRTLYRRDDLSALLPLGEVQPLSLHGESYKLAFTPGLLAQVFQRPRTGHPAEPLLPDPASVLGGQAGNQGGYLRSQTLKADGRFPASACVVDVVGRLLPGVEDDLLVGVVRVQCGDHALGRVVEQDENEEDRFCGC